jgi:hypothetical protein
MVSHITYQDGVREHRTQAGIELKDERGVKKQ